MDGVTQPHSVNSTYPIPSPFVRPSVRSFGGVGRSHQSARLSNPPFVRPHVRTFVRSFVVALCGAARVQRCYATRRWISFGFTIDES